MVHYAVRFQAHTIKYHHSFLCLDRKKVPVAQRAYCRYALDYADSVDLALLRQQGRWQGYYNIC